MSKLNLAVIFGSQSGEHEVSLSSAKSVINALDKNKYNIIPIAITKKGNWLIGDKGADYMELQKEKAGKEGAVSIEDSQKLVSIKDADKSLMNFAEGKMNADKIDLVLPILHGNYGEDGRLQGMLDMFGVPYVFSGVLAHSIAMNKPKAKILAKNSNVPVPKDIEVNKDNYNIDDIIKAIPLPAVIKPSELGSSVGISIAKSKEELSQALKKALEYGEHAMVEQYIKGREITVTILGTNKNPIALTPIEIIPIISDFYDYKAKYEDGGSRHDCPADIPEDIKNKVEKYAVQVFKAIGCEDLARADFIWNEEDKELYFIDLNTIPGMTATSLAPEAAKKSGIPFSDLLDKLIDNALERAKNLK